MEKIECKNCHKLNNAKRDYCWLCGKCLKDNIVDIKETKKVSNKKVKIECENCKALNNPKNDRCYLCAKELKGNEVITENKYKNVIIIFSIISIIAIIFILLYISAVLNNSAALMGAFNFGIFGLILLIPILIIIWGVMNISEYEKVPKKIQTAFRCRYLKGSLDLLPNSLCIIDLLDDFLEISNSGSIYRIKYEQVINIYFTSYEEIERIYKTSGSSYSKTLLGDLLFGLPGAIAGASSSNQLTSSIEKKSIRYLIIRYKSKKNKKENIYISLDDNFRKFNKRLIYIKENYIVSNSNTILEEL